LIEQDLEQKVHNAIDIHADVPPMKIDKDHKRRVRIQGSPDDTVGHNVHICDVETGEEIINVKSAIVYLDVKDMNKVELTYYKSNYTTEELKQHDGPPIERITLDNPEIDVIALEE
jgi:hypothetical protein